MSPKSFTGIQDSRLIYNDPEGGVLPQSKPGERRVTTPSSTFGSTSPTGAGDVRPKEPTKVTKQAVITSKGGRIVVEYK